MLHIINKSPLTNGSFENCLRVAEAGEIILIEDAVYAATKGGALEAKVREVMGRYKIHVLMPDLEARGLADRLMDGVTAVDYGGFVDLVAGNKNCQSWL
ncbi:MAG: sulfurtransferase TusB [Gallionellales bacterium 35-53-114]|jgi:tRNA 2-thiouridine synthesizing protein B|nr:MAG: sulfurtransferase TusB [Gallionellales bacterium 35-53-114]OYZ64496.1 MAG: sulfurtransferase TusB [Gallionellales bacterium 24-53-125]OZB10198.1 MAG: sulfurtransferase TusB [Gallionellales bacterium 39-52-133]HQS56787.1 sulfurtransferase complex subunit TusB [Gallionellaceae bacterium]HQS75429.1 sulfurtransferase complex subunit TusB [Gallionellaceae bacterium]